MKDDPNNWIGVGMVFGLLFGSFMDNIPIGIAIGLVVGIGIAESKKRGSGKSDDDEDR